MRAAPDARRPRRRRLVLRHVPPASRRAHGRVRLHEHLLLALRRAGAVRRVRRARRGGPGRQHPLVRVPGRLRHRTDGVGQRHVRRAAHDRRRAGAARPDPPRRGAAARASRSRAGRASTPTPAEAPRDRHPALPRDRRAGARDARRLRAARRLRLAARGAADAARGADRDVQGRGPARPRRRRVQHGPEGLVPAQGRHAEVRRLQRRRVRAGHVQGPRADAEEPASARRGPGHRRLRRRGDQELHLHPRRVRAAGGRPRRRDRRGLREGLPRRGHPRLRLRASRCTSRAAPARTSAARRPGCSTRSRASAATRA